MGRLAVAVGVGTIQEQSDPASADKDDIAAVLGSTLGTPARLMCRFAT